MIDHIGPYATTRELGRGGIAQLYPGDQAIGFEEGELRGWFWVEVPSATDKE